MGVAGLNQFAKRIPAIDIMEQPFLFNFEELVRATAKPRQPDPQADRCRPSCETIGVRVLWWQSVGNQIFISKGKTTDGAGPDQGPQDPGVQPHARAVRQAVRRHSRDGVGQQDARGIPDAGEIDMATGASSLIANRQLWTVADTITRTLHAPIEFFLIVNEKVWQSLPEAHRAIILEAAGQRGAARAART